MSRRLGVGMWTWMRALFLVLAVAVAQGFVTGDLAAQAQEMHAGAPPIMVHDRAPSVPAEWMVVEGTWLRVYGREDELSQLMHYSRVGSDAVGELAEELGVPIGGTIHVVLAPTQQAFYDVQPGGVPEWADGTAWPSLGQIYLRRPRIRDSDRPLEQVLRHEIVHILLGRAFAPEHPPTWLQEGTATLLSGEYGPDMGERFVQSVGAGYAPSLDALSDGFPSHSGRASIAYAESADFMAYMRATYGEDAIPQMVRSGAAGESMASAVRTVSGEFMPEVERDWLRRFNRPTLNWVTMLSNWEAWWAMLAGVSVVGLVLARRRSVKRMRDMADEEARMDELLASLWKGQSKEVH